LTLTRDHGPHAVVLPDPRLARSPLVPLRDFDGAFLRAVSSSPFRVFLIFSGVFQWAVHSTLERCFFSETPRSLFSLLAGVSSGRPYSLTYGNMTP